MSPPQSDIAELVRRSRAEQGLSEMVTDPAVLARVANILEAGRDNAPRVGGVANNSSPSSQSNTTPHGWEVSRD